ncbi:hypothetical protein Tco_1151986 [Tanacetum coccineum]
MAQSQSSPDVHQDELRPPNKRYAFMDGNKKVDLENPLCPDESRILANILKNHPIRFSIAASSAVSWIYLGTIFQLPQATDNNHDHFVPAPTFSKMIYKAYDESLHDYIPCDVMIKSIFNSGKRKGIVGMRIPYWMITDEMKLAENYRLYAEVFGIDVPTTQSQPIESTQERHRTTSAPRIPNLVVAQGESNDLILQDTLQVSLAEHKSHEELEATQNVEKVKEHLMAEEIKKLVEGSENVEENVAVHSSPLRNDDNQTVLDTRLEPKSDKEKEEESAEDDYDLRRRKKGKHVEDIRNTPSSTTIRSPRIPTNLECQNLRSEISTQVNDAIANHIPSTQEQQYQLYLTMKDDPRLQKDDVSIWLALKIKFERLQVATTSCIPSVFCLRDQEDPHDDAHPKGENSAKRQNTSEYGTFEIGGSSSGQDYKSEPGPSKSCNQGQSEDFDYWTDSYAIDDDVLPNEKASQDLVNEISQTVDEANDIVWESRKKIIVPPYQLKPTPVVQSCQRDPKAPGLPLVYQDLLYLKKGNSGPDKIILSLHKFPVVIFPDDDTEEKQIVARRANRSIVSITESDYKNLNKNDIEDMYLLIINHKVDDYVETRLLWSLSVFIRSIVIWERVHDFQLVYGIIYKNNKKEKRVMRHQEVHKFCDATLKRVLEGLKSYNNDVKYGYVTHNLSKEDVE